MLERLFMSRMFRRYIESLIVVWCPWVILLEQEPITLQEAITAQERKPYDPDPSKYGCQINLVDGMHYGPCKGSCKEEDSIGEDLSRREV